MNTRARNFVILGVVVLGVLTALVMPASTSAGHPDIAVASGEATRLELLF